MTAGNGSDASMVGGADKRADKKGVTAHSSAVGIGSWATGFTIVGILNRETKSMLQK